MHKIVFALCFVVVLGVAAPLSAEAQLREEARVDRAAPQLYDSEASGTLLNRLFSPEVFQMSHSYEMSMGSFGGNAHSLGMYTNTMAWQLSDKVAARVDVSAAFSPLGGANFGQQNDNMRVFLRNAEVVYQPSENTTFHLQIRQSPYGQYASPYGHYGPYSGMNQGHGQWSPFD